MNRTTIKDPQYIHAKEELISGISFLLKTQGGIKKRLQKSYSYKFANVTDIPDTFSDNFKNFICDMENLEHLTEEEICKALDNIF